MLKRKLFLVFGLLLVLSSLTTLKAQSNVAIVLNEYSASNFSGVIDNYGNQSDWVEIYNAHTSSVTLNGYWLSNDRNNLKKWAFPSTFTMSSGSYKAVWLSGKNKTVGSNYHTNFTLDQCKNQWLILTTAQGVVRDSIFVQRTKANHTRGRVDIFNIGVAAWRLYPTNSFTLSNPTVPGSFYRNYAPTPSFTPATVYNSTVNAGGFYPPAVPINQIDIFLGGAADSSGGCFEIHYTIDGSVPTMTDAIYSFLNPIIVVNTSIIRAVAFPTTLTPISTCTLDYLPSFCQTNTYFIDQEHNDFHPEFGVVSLAIDKLDTNWFNAGGINPGPQIHVEYYDKKVQMTEGYAQISRPPNESWITKQKGLFITIDDRRGFGCNFEGNVFNVEGLGTTPRRSFYTLHLKAGDFESHSSVPSPTNGGISFGTGIRDVFYQSLAAKNNLHVSPLHIKPVVAFINGKYSGVYDLRECYDAEFERYYNGQSKDSLDMLFYHNNDGAVTTFSNNFRTSVYDWITTQPMNNASRYNTAMSRLDKESFIDYMILNSYAMNSDIWNFNVAYARGGQPTKPGNKFHYYLWNTPAIFNFTAVATNTLVYNSIYTSPCTVHSSTYAVSPGAGNGHGNMLYYLMRPNTGNLSFQLEYKNRYQDLLNGPLKCENILAHFDYVKSLYLKEFKYHEDPASVPLPGQFNTAIDLWDTLTSELRRTIYKRCDFVQGGSPNTGFNVTGCYGMTGPFDITVDVKPAGAGSVKLNSLVLNNYLWKGRYYSTTMALKAIPLDTTFVFHHWEFENHTPLNSAPLSLDSLAIGFNRSENVVAVFTDKKNDVIMPTGFSPNGDGNNDMFMPLGSALFAREYDFRIWNRWGQEVFRSTDPTQGWDGYFKGQQAITGVYAYLITYKNIFNESKLLKGNVTLVR
ncbi:MAG: gliding motility-associated C-terminal domain-containing protein [Bacteroidota bacterium]|nr:gliding motility-associated C-terminal domain-containing protein [Bacteroidota bacterium]MDP3146242.1 gliding motility-associated C-terminal domain-containing protein [Bacteroidota bacterium]